MSAKWISTNFKGVRYYVHPTRKIGGSKGLRDKYFAIRYQRYGKRVEEGIGWASDLDPKDGKNWTPEKVALVLAELKEAAKGLKQGASRLSERRAEDDKRKEGEKAEQELREQEAVTFKEIFTKKYFPIAKQNKTKGAWATEESLFNLWIEPVIGKLPLKEISPILLERIKKNMGEAGRSPRSVAYVLSLIRQVYNFSRRNRLYDGSWPGADKAVKIPKKDNRRQRFLTHEEAEALLSALKEKSQDVHDMSLMALHCGLRASEIFALTWGDVDIEKETLFIKDPKNKHNRYAFMTNAVKTILEEKSTGARNELVFMARNTNEDGTQKQVDRISKTFSRIVDSLKLNEGVDDVRQKVVFHSLRHTFASWLVQDGVDLYTVKELMGHEHIDMTERYSHLSPVTMRSAVKTLEKGIDAARQTGQVVNFTK
jgi:integrase